MYAQEKWNNEKIGVRAAYMSSVVSPGFKLGIEYQQKVKSIRRERDSLTKTTLKERYWSLNLGFYSQRDFHSNLYLVIERQFRRQYRNGFFMELSPGIGYSRTFLRNTTYALKDDGTIYKKTLAGHNYLMLSMSGSCGYDFSKKKDLHLKLFFKPTLFTILPFNSSKLIRPSYELGFIFTPFK
jgi:hypothetical protein